MEQLLLSHQKQCAEGMVNAAFQVEVEGCIELLGPFAPDKTSVALEILSTSKMPELANFCRARKVAGTLRVPSASNSKESGRLK